MILFMMMKNIWTKFLKLTERVLNALLEFVISLQRKGFKPKIIKTTMIKIGEPNINGLVYSKQAIDNIMETILPKIKNKRALGELDGDGQTVSLDRVSHLVTSIKNTGKEIICEAKTMDVPYGNIANTLLDSGVELRLAPRGNGNVCDGEIQNYKLVSIDLVSDKK